MNHIDPDLEREMVAYQESRARLDRAREDHRIVAGSKFALLRKFVRDLRALLFGSPIDGAGRPG